MKIYHGPANIGGIGRYLADWQREQGVISDFVTYVDKTNRVNHHLNLQLDKYGVLRRSLVMVLWLFICILKYDLFHFYFGRTLLPFNMDLPLLKLFGKKLVMTYCGSEVRLIEVEHQRNPYSDLLKISLNDPKYDKRKKTTMYWQNLWVDRFIAPRNLYNSAAAVIPESKVEKDIWIHNTMEIASFVIQDFYTRDNTPVLVHAPSEMGIKGTEYVEKAIESLKEKGYKFEYIRLYKVPNDEAQRIYREEADIIIDQLLLGGFGNLAVEGMYYGKPVVGYIIEEVREKYYPDCPVVNATIDNLEEKLAWLIENPDERIRIGRKGREFVERHLDRDKINQKLWEMYQTL